MRQGEGVVVKRFSTVVRALAAISRDGRGRLGESTTRARRRTPAANARIRRPARDRSMRSRVVHRAP